MSAAVAFLPTKGSFGGGLGGTAEVLPAGGPLSRRLTLGPAPWCRARARPQGGPGRAGLGAGKGGAKKGLHWKSVSESAERVRRSVRVVYGYQRSAVFASGFAKCSNGAMPASAGC